MRIRGIAARCALLGAGFALMAFGPAPAPESTTSTEIASSQVASGDVASADVRTLSMYEIHTKETITVTYKRDGKFDEDGLKKLRHFMRDWRTGDTIEMDRELIDLIWTIHNELGSKEPIHLISGYRSPKTNAKLRRAGGGQAKKSQHTLGRASDIHFPDVPVSKLRASALIQEVGGVGYYPRSGIPFVHVDTGRVRMWPRMPRLQLAALFPEGKTDYLPSDGRRITKKDYDLALAKGLVNRTLVASAGPRPNLVPMPTPKPRLAYAPEAPQTMMTAEADAPQTAKPAQPRRIASAAPALANMAAPMTLGPANDDSVTEPPRFASANAGGGGLPFARTTLRPTTPQTTAALPKPAEAKPAPSKAAQAKAVQPKPTEAEPASYDVSRIAKAPAIDDEHPDELTFEVFETASLMNETSVAHDRDVAPLTHPEQTDIDYLFEDMDRPTHFKLRRTSGYLGLASVQTLSGLAVRSLYAEADTGKPTRLAQATR